MKIETTNYYVANDGSKHNDVEGATRADILHWVKEGTEGERVTVASVVNQMMADPKGLGEIMAQIWTADLEPADA